MNSPFESLKQYRASTSLPDEVNTSIRHAKKTMHGVSKHVKTQLENPHLLSYGYFTSRGITLRDWKRLIKFFPHLFVQVHDQYYVTKENMTKFLEANQDLLNNPSKYCTLFTQYSQV